MKAVKFDGFFIWRCLWPALFAISFLGKNPKKDVASIANAAYQLRIAITKFLSLQFEIKGGSRVDIRFLIAQTNFSTKILLIAPKRVRFEIKNLRLRI